MADWSIQQAREMYHVAHWSDGYFDVCDKGRLRAYPNGKLHESSIDLHELAGTLAETGVRMPVLLRFTDILRNRIQNLNEAFANAIKEHDYQGKYLSAYPIKVNQQRHVVESILGNGKATVGIETGSKPELLAALGLIGDQKPTIICNGYKDREYIRLALIAQKLGRKVYIILEKFSELGIALEEAEKLNTELMLGVRVRLASRVEGKWQDSGGEKSKFGFTAPELLKIVQTLHERGKLDVLRVLHFHLGSQVANIGDIQRGMHEGVRYYQTLRELGAPIDTIDVGGGLGIDYEGTRSRSYCSINYSMQEYANNIVYTIFDTCNQHQLPHPKIITESGRAMTAHHAMLITNIISVVPPCDLTALKPPKRQHPHILHEFWESYNTLCESNAREGYHDACHWLTEIHTMYIHGMFNLEERAHAEQIYFAVCEKLRSLLKPNIRAHRQIIDEINQKLAHKFVCNFSLFQSLPDAWAIDQVFPIMPLSGLDNPPAVHGVLHDITCDSDGCINTYVNNYGLESTLPLPEYDPNKPYLIGIFLVGAYQEILGDLHNLFGDTDSIHIEVLKDGGFKLTNPAHGDTVEKALQHVAFNGADLIQSYNEQLKAADITQEECTEYFNDLTRGLSGYTYFEEE